MVLFDLLVNILGHNLAEPAYEAEVAQLEYKLVAGEHGLVVKVKGFNHKLSVSERMNQICTYTNTYKLMHEHFFGQMDIYICICMYVRDLC